MFDHNLQIDLIDLADVAHHDMNNMYRQMVLMYGQVGQVEVIQQNFMTPKLQLSRNPKTTDPDASGNASAAADPVPDLTTSLKNACCTCKPWETVV